MNPAHFDHLRAKGAVILNNRQKVKPTIWRWRNIYGLENGIQVANCFKVPIGNEKLMVSMLDLRLRAAPTRIRRLYLIFRTRVLAHLKNYKSESTVSTNTK